MSNKKLITANICRWAGRVAGALLVAVIVLLAIGEGMPNILTQPHNVQIGFLALAILILGILAAWKWELAGGLVSIGGWCLFVVAVVHFPRGVNGFMLSLLLPGTLSVISSLLRGRLPKSG